jgi:ABC-type molybdenum transport system ATPase subunit/photorepair protein PhrA
MRLKALTVRNFRGFGSAAETIDLDRDLVLFYGPNGHGKTSLAEAIEWLFYGTTKRRQRGEDFSKAEYANTFANVHGGMPTEVALKVHLNGVDVELSRRLGPKETSDTYIDGAPGVFSTLGVTALEAFYPVVAQHGLQTFVHSKPKDRRDAICAAFGLEELTSLKSALESARGSFQRTPPAAITEARSRLAALTQGLSLTPATADVARRWGDTPVSVDPALDQAALLAAAADLTGQACANRAEAVQALRSARAAVGRAVFDTAPIALNEAHDELKRDAAQRLQAVQAASAGVDDAVAAVSAATAASFSAALLRFWSEGLTLAGEQGDCPMCEEPTLSDAHKVVLRDRIAASEELVTASDLLTKASQTWHDAFPPAVNAVAALGLRGLDAKGREGLAAILGTHEHLAGFLEAHDVFVARQRQLGEALRCNKELGVATRARAGAAASLPALVEDRKAARQTLGDVVTQFAGALEAYEAAWRLIAPEVEAVIAGNDAVFRIDAVGKALGASDAVTLLARYAAVLEEAQTLIRAVEASAQTKQEDLLKSRGTEVAHLYKLLNQGALVGFDTMEPANDALKLHATSFGVRMPAAANLSECQLNCLGLAVWLMRATTKASPFGFILLDDPVQAMDDDHAEAFIAQVIPHLLDDHGKQVVVLSHVRSVTDKLRALNLHRSAQLFHYENYLQTGPVIVLQVRLQQQLAEIKGAAAGNEANRQYAVDRLRVLVEEFVRELHLVKAGQPPPTTHDTANSGQLLDLFRSIPDTSPEDHAGMKDTVRFCDPAHHSQVGYAPPQRTAIQPHIDRVSGLMKKYGLIK